MAPLFILRQKLHRVHRSSTRVENWGDRWMKICLCDGPINIVCTFSQFWNDTPDCAMPDQVEYVTKRIISPPQQNRQESRECTASNQSGSVWSARLDTRFVEFHLLCKTKVTTERKKKACENISASAWLTELEPIKAHFSSLHLDACSRLEKYRSSSRLVCAFVMFGLCRMQFVKQYEYRACSLFLCLQNTSETSPFWIWPTAMTNYYSDLKVEKKQCCNPDCIMSNDYLHSGSSIVWQTNWNLKYLLYDCLTLNWWDMLALYNVNTDEMQWIK